jgi:hypothetical protein
MDIPEYLSNLPVEQNNPKVEELMMKVLLECWNEGITELSVGSLLLLFGIDASNISEEMYEDYVTLTPEGIEMAIAIKQKDGQVIQ